MRMRGSKLPQPQAFALLGDVHRMSVRSDSGLTRYHWGATAYRSDGDFDRSKAVECPERPPQLLWAPDLRAIFMFPGFYVHASAFTPGKAPPHAAAALKAFTAWDHSARKSDVRIASPDYPEPPVRAMGSAFDVVYRSEKWNGRGGAREDYQHHFSKSGRVHVYADEPRQPSCLLVRGGRLAVTSRGIVY